VAVLLTKERHCKVAVHRLAVAGGENDHGEEAASQDVSPLRSLSRPSHSIVFINAFPNFSDTQESRNISLPRSALACAVPKLQHAFQTLRPLSRVYEGPLTEWFWVAAPLVASKTPA
jgi:hypothetical protein